jgi:superfamily II DNA or RNA helicase
MKERDYQIECRNRIHEEWKTKPSTLAVLATGLGKTIIFAHVIKDLWPKKALVLAHRQELIWQARDKIEQATGLTCEIEMADLKVQRSLFHKSNVVVASVQTMISGRDVKRMTRFRPEEFGVLIIDEAHHSTAGSYAQIITYFKQNPDLKILGVTATPDRADKEALGTIFESVAYQYEMLNGINDGWLVDVSVVYYHVKSLDFSEVKTTAGDLNKKGLAKVMEVEENVQGICQPTLEVMYGLPTNTLKSIPVLQWNDYLSSLKKVPRRTIVFTASVAHAEACCNIFNRAVPHLAEWVCAETDIVERKTTLENFQSGKTALVANCGVLTEGFDNPGVEVIAMGRPTKSRSLYAQMIGRSTRTLPGLVDGIETSDERKKAIAASPKPFCRIIDFVGNSGEHRLITPFDVLGGKFPADVVEAGIKRAQDSEKPKMVCRTLTVAEVKLEQEKQAAMERARLEAEARKAKWVAKVNGYSHKMDPWDSHDQGALQVGSKAWRNRPLSEKQLYHLCRKGYNPDRLSRWQALSLLKKISEEEGWYKKRKDT